MPSTAIDGELAAKPCSGQNAKALKLRCPPKAKAGHEPLCAKTPCAEPCVCGGREKQTAHKA
eukprot:10949537-Alexandrium_andersonii.AAC.1